MSAFRRILGILVMCAGVLGLLLSLAGLVFVWVVKPVAASSIDATITTLSTSISTSQQAMRITEQALQATIDSVDALSTMLGATAASVQDTKPMLGQLNTFLGQNLPDTMESATSSIRTAEQGAEVLDSTIRSLNTFRTVLSGAPLIGGFVEPPDQPYDPEKPLAASLGELASNLEELPDMFIQMASNLDNADDNLDTIQASLTTMSESVSLIAGSLGEYEAMVSQSQSSMDNLLNILNNLQSNLTTILNTAAILLSLFFLWLLAAQVVIFSQGWELYKGTADRMGSEDMSSSDAGAPDGDLEADDPAQSEEPDAGQLVG